MGQIERGSGEPPVVRSERPDASVDRADRGQEFHTLIDKSMQMAENFLHTTDPAAKVLLQRIKNGAAQFVNMSGTNLRTQGIVIASENVKRFPEHMRGEDQATERAAFVIAVARAIAKNR